MEGLGIRSMKERVGLVGGRFEIHSELGKGTRLEAWVTLQTKPALTTEDSRGKPSLTGGRTPEIDRL